MARPLPPPTTSPSRHHHAPVARGSRTGAVALPTSVPPGESDDRSIRSGNLTWHAQDIDVPGWGLARFWRAYGARYGEGVSLVVGATTNGRFQGRSGTHAQSTTEIAVHGAYFGTWDTADDARTALQGWLEGA